MIGHWPKAYLIILVFTNCLTCRAVCELLACRELGKSSQSNPSTKLRPRWLSCLRERVEISIHNPSHKQQSSVHIFPAKAPSLLHQAPSTAIHTQIICLQTDTISSSAHKRREKQQRCPQIYLEIPSETCVPPVRLTSALKVPEQAQFICLHDSGSIHQG